MNILSASTRKLILEILLTGQSMRMAAQEAKCSVNTVTKLLVDIGNACAVYQDKVMHNLSVKHVQCNTIWSFSIEDAKNLFSLPKTNSKVQEIYTWIARDIDTNLIVGWRVAPVDEANETKFLRDVKDRLCHQAIICGKVGDQYLNVAENALTNDVVRGHTPMFLDLRLDSEPIHVRHKKIARHISALSLHLMCHNFCAPGQSEGITSAMAAGISDHVWSIDEIIALQTI